VRQSIKKKEWAKPRILWFPDADSVWDFYKARYQPDQLANLRALLNSSSAICELPDAKRRGAK